MAELEARSACQQPAKCCFLHKDAKSTSDLASCPSSSSSSTSGTTDMVCRQGNLDLGPRHPCSNPISPYKQPDSKWWLRLQTNLEHQMDVQRDFFYGCNCHQTKEAGWDAGSKEKFGSLMDHQCKVCSACVQNDYDLEFLALEAGHDSKSEIMRKHKDIGEFWYPDVELMQLDDFSSLTSEPSHKCSVDFKWMGNEKTEPWWRVADNDELACLVAQKSLEHVENCDLPRPQTKHLHGESIVCRGSFNYQVFNLVSENKAETVVTQRAGYPQESSVISLDDKYPALGNLGLSTLLPEKTFSNRDNGNSNHQGESHHVPRSNLSKAQLLEALRHSQTRAREAEKAAHQASTEREHIIKLFFRQASQLFAYKQWFHILQLETLCLQLKNVDHPLPPLFPAALPWFPSKRKPLRRGHPKLAAKNHGQPWYEAGRCAVAFTIGLGLAGAGLLLGWTMGWF